MISVHIIDKLKKERERQEHEWQPLHIPAEPPSEPTGEREIGERKEKKDKKPEQERGIAIFGF